MQELIVIFSCLYNKGCNSSISAYSVYNPDTVEAVTSYKNYLGSNIDSIAAAASMIYNKEVKFVIDSNIIGTINDSGAYISFTKEVKL